MNNTTRHSREKVMKTPRAGVSPLKCPSCGQHMAWTDQDFENNRFRVRCASCGTEGPVARTFERAIVEWNSFPRY